MNVRRRQVSTDVRPSTTQVQATYVRTYLPGELCSGGIFGAFSAIVPVRVNSESRWLLLGSLQHLYRGPLYLPWQATT